LPELFEELETPRAIVYGHSHIPLHEVTGTGLHLINPGAAGKPRFNTSPTLAILTQDDTTGDLIVTHQDIPV
jgi:predicted phosphodiesterase